MMTEPADQANTPKLQGRRQQHESQSVLMPVAKAHRMTRSSRRPYQGTGQQNHRPGFYRKATISSGDAREGDQTISDRLRLSTKCVGLKLLEYGAFPFAERDFYASQPTVISMLQEYCGAFFWTPTKKPNRMVCSPNARGNVRTAPGLQGISVDRRRGLRVLPGK